jgi:hypothetical protein
MTDVPSIDANLAVGGHVAGADSSVILDVSVTADLPLPALRVEVDEFRAGLVLALTHTADGFELVPRLTGPEGPSGAAITVELAGVSGGGQLAFTNGEWRGGVTLIIGPLKVNGYALLSGDSFLIVLSGRFPQPGIQVGFGFAVSGVGGIFGVNRRTDVAAITSAVLDGSLGNLLFPNDPEHDMVRILSSLPRLFPPQTGQALLGPMFEINWSGGLLKAQAALILEGPDPVRLSCIGRLIVDLPTPDLALVHLQATFAATADFGVPELRIVASLTGSHIVGLALTGDVFLLIRGGRDSTFVVSAGGFHPAVRPPAGVPALQRLGMAMRFGVAELRYESYFAVTTSSVQFGARAELRASLAECGVHGWFGFDALIEWVPRFHFTVGVSAGFEVEVFGESLLGVRLSGVLEGPAPWHLSARGEVEVLFVSVSISIDVTFGNAPAPITAVPDVAAQLVTALQDASAWTLQPPAADDDGVVLSPTAAAAVASGRLLHPAGPLQVRQRLLPFGITVDRFGGYAVPEQRWRLTGVRLRQGSEILPPTGTISDQFAMGMFRGLSQAEQLSTTAFTEQPCGATLTPSGVAIGEARDTEIDWDTVVVGPAERRTVLNPGHLSAIHQIDVTPFVPTFRRAIDTPWSPRQRVSVLNECPSAVVAVAPIVGLVPVAMTAPIDTAAAAAEAVRAFDTTGTRAVVVEQWEVA